MKTTIAIMAVGAALSAAAVGYLVAQPAPTKEGGPPARRAGDEAAIKLAGLSFVKAYTEGDAKAMAAHWTEDGEYFAEDGTILRGRERIAQSYARLFARKRDRVQAEVEVASIRFPSRDTAIEEGVFKARVGKEAPVASKYTVVYAREGGKWLMAVVREWPSEGASVRDLEWLLGTWEARREGIVVRTSYEWWGEKAFLRGTVTIHEEGRSFAGFQMIGKDAATGEIRSWAFDAGGSFSQATWGREGRRWTQDTAIVLDTGSTLSAKHILTRIDDDTLTFQAVERSQDGEPLPDIPPIRVTRVKGKEGRP